MKNLIIGLLQFVLGYRLYLKIFSILKILILRFDNRKKDYLLFTNKISEDSQVLVIGANTGITTVPIARRLKTGQVLAVEPIRTNADVMKSVLSFFNVEKKVTILISALGDRNGEVKMVVPKWGITRKHGFAHVSGIENTNDDPGETSTCIIQRLDDNEEIKNRRVDFIKIVAENYELNIFKGAKNTIQLNRPIIYCELWDNAFRKPVLDLISSYNYQVCVFRNSQLHNYDPLSDKQKYFLFLPLNSDGNFNSPW